MKIGWSMILACILFLNSCSSGRIIKEYTAKIDSLTFALESNSFEYFKIDTIQIIAKLHEMEQQTELLDSLNVNHSLPTLLEYNNMQQSFNFFLRENAEILDEVEFSKKQLFDLKFDVENKLIENNEAKLYFELELDAVADLQRKMDLYSQKIQMQFHNLELINPKIDNLIDSLSNN